MTKVHCDRCGRSAEIAVRDDAYLVHKADDTGWEEVISAQGRFDVCSAECAEKLITEKSLTPPLLQKKVLRYKFLEWRKN